MGLYKTHVLSMTPMPKLIISWEKAQFSQNHALCSIEQHIHIYNIIS